MTNRENAMNILCYRAYDKLPVVHFGFWNETLDKWVAEGHLAPHEKNERAAAAKLGFDFGWNPCVSIGAGLQPSFAREVIKDFGDGTRHVRNGYGVVELVRDGAGSIPQEIAHTLVDRASWEEHYLPRLQFTANRLPNIDDFSEDMPRGLHVGSLYGDFRNWAGVTGTSYLYADDEDLYTEIINTIGQLNYNCLERTLAMFKPGTFDYAHYWEDICFKTGPLVVPAVFHELVGPHYKRMTTLLTQHNIDIVSLDCDGLIDSLLPIWLSNGVNTMFPIEVGTWEASIAPWRKKYGRELRGVGGMNKTVFAHDFAVIDAEIVRLKDLVKLGGYLPCPDHRIAPDAKWDNVVYYVQKMRET